MKYRSTLLIVLLAAVTCANEAAAHGLEIFVTQTDQSNMFVKVTYDDNAPVAGTEVKIITGSGEYMQTIKTNADGTFSLPVYAHDVTLEVSTPDGHRITHKVKSTQSDLTQHSHDSDTHTHAPEQPIEQTDLAFLAQKITQLEEQIHAYQHNVRLHDIIGGIGYIVGVMGLIVFLKRPKSS